MSLLYDSIKCPSDAAHSWRFCIITAQSNIPITIVKDQINCNLKIVVHMSELSQMIELDILSNSETPNLATLYRLASTGS